MCVWLRTTGRWAAALGMLAAAGLLPVAGCASGGSAWEYIGSPFPYAPTGAAATGPTTTGRTGVSLFGQADRTHVDPCAEPLARKFVTVSMRNYSDDYIHYFFVAIAFIDVDETAPDTIVPSFDGTPFPNGAVCPDDIPLYRQNGYNEVRPGEWLEFGDYCLVGPALYYYHQSGRFRRTAGSGPTGLGSAIAPAQGTMPTYDEFFNSVGARIPVPDLILFHNPGGPLKVSAPVVSPCSVLTVAGAPICDRDSFYYVSEDDTMAGSRALGVGSGRRAPREIQGTGCECKGMSQPYQILAPSRVTVLGADCNEFFRGGRIEYAFVRDDQTPAYPQLLWRVRDAGGAIVHDFDAQSGLAPAPIGG